MQKKELRKSWRRKLAALLAGTLIAGVFGISMPMTAKAAPNSPANLTLTVSDQFTTNNDPIFKEQTQQTATATITIENRGETEFIPTTDNVQFSDGADSAFRFLHGVKADAHDGSNPGVGEITIGLVNDLSKFADGVHREVVRCVAEGVQNPFTVELSVNLATTTYGIDATDSKGFSASTTTSYDFGKDKVGGTFTAHEFTLTNKGNAPVDYSQLSVTTPEYFTVTGMPTSGKLNDNKITIAAKADKATDGPVTEEITFSIKNPQNEVKASVTVVAVVEVLPLKREMKVTSIDGKQVSKIEPIDFDTGNTAPTINYQGSYTAPLAKKVIITNTGDYTIGGLKATTDSEGVTVSIDNNQTSIPTGAGNNTREITVTPKDTGLTAGDYSGNLTISATGVDDIVIPIKFELVDCDYTVEATDNPTTSGVKPVAITEIAFDERGEGYQDADALATDVKLTLKGDTAVTGAAKIVDAAGKAYNKFTVAKKTGGSNDPIALNQTGDSVIYVVKPNNAETLTEGDYSGKLVFEFNETDDIEIPLSFSVKKGTYTFDVQDVTDSKNPKNITEHDFGKKVENGYKFTTIAEAKSDNTLTADEIAINVKNTGNSKIYLKAKVTETSTDRAFTALENDLKTALDGKSIEVGKTLDQAINLLPDVDKTQAKIKPGTYTATLKLESYDNDPSAQSNPGKLQATKTLTFTFEVEEEKVQITVTPRSYDFGALPTGFKVGKEVQAKTITVKNTGNKDVTVNLTRDWKATQGTTGVAEFTFTKPSITTNTLKVGESATVMIAPDDSKAPVYNFNPGANNSYATPYTLKAKGINEDQSTGEDSNEVKINAAFFMIAPETKIEAVTKSVDMKLFANATQAEAEAQEKEVTIKNTGNVAVTMAPIQSGTFFFVELPDVDVVDAGATYTFKVRPRAGIASGKQTAKLKVNFDNSLNEDIEIPVTLTITNTGWRKQEDGWYYYKDGSAAKGWLKTGGKWYFLDKSTGLMKTGWLKDDGKWYYLKASGAMASNEWVKDGGKYYFFKSGGAMASAQWVSWKGDWYYMNAGGSMKTEGWTKSAGKWYYMGKDGKMVKSTSVTVKGKTYKFDKNGVCTNP